MAGLGTLALVVGPSGAGKDTLLDGALNALLPTGRFHRAQRIVTRPADAGGEAHEAVTEAAFLAAEASGALLLSWRAHGLCYGIPREPSETSRAEGRCVIANVSRGVIDEARALLQPVAVICVSAPADVLAGRLAARGRESEADIRARLARVADNPISGRDVLTVSNAGDLADGVAAMTAALEAASLAEWQPAD